MRSTRDCGSPGAGGASRKRSASRKALTRKSRSTSEPSARSSRSRNAAISSRRLRFSMKYSSTSARPVFGEGITPGCTRALLKKRWRSATRTHCERVRVFNLVNVPPHGSAGRARRHVPDSGLHRGHLPSLGPHAGSVFPLRCSTMRTSLPPVHLSYCTNIHPGESWPEVRANLERYLVPVRERVAPGRPFGVGLRLSAESARALAAPEALRELRGFLRAHDLYVFTINGFPY